jgi:predicted secreted hydrolase
MIARRLRLVLVALLLAGQTALAQTAPPRPAPDYAVVKPGHPLAFPVDHGAHPLYRTEWWYLTGWLNGPGGPQGFQITIFRSRTGADPRNPSAFSARQILFAHAALSDPKVGRLLHDQRIARQGFGLAETALTDTDIVLDDWSLKREPDGRFIARAGGKAFWLDLALTPTQPPLPQGIDGYSRKGPLPKEASHYYSVPHLKVTGSVRRAGRPVRVTGEAWLDREWSSTLLDPKAVGWDWTGINLDDGSALMAFQVRDAAGRALWSGGSLRAPTGTVDVFKPADVAFGARRLWRSPRTGADYPVERLLTVRTAQGLRRFSLTPLFDDQELDSRGAGGPVYWEGAVRTEGGRGYLELTGYVSPLRL